MGHRIGTINYDSWSMSHGLYELLNLSIISHVQSIIVCREKNNFLPIRITRLVLVCLDVFLLELEGLKDLQDFVVTV